MKLRDLAIWGFLALALVTVFTLMNRPSPSASMTTMPYSTLLNEVDNGRVKEVTIVGPQARGRLQDDKSFVAVVPTPATDLLARMEKANVEIRIEEVPRANFLTALIANLLPLLIMVGLWFFLMRQMSGGGGKGG